MPRFVVVRDIDRWRVMDKSLGLYLDAAGVNAKRRYATREEAERVAALWNELWARRNAAMGAVTV